jgi:hypothetical protein
LSPIAEPRLALSEVTNTWGRPGSTDASSPLNFSHLSSAWADYGMAPETTASSSTSNLGKSACDQLIFEDRFLRIASKENAGIWADQIRTIGLLNRLQLRVEFVASSTPPPRAPTLVLPKGDFHNPAAVEAINLRLHVMSLCARQHGFEVLLVNETKTEEQHSLGPSRQSQRPSLARRSKPYARPSTHQQPMPVSLSALLARLWGCLTLTFVF